MTCEALHGDGKAWVEDGQGRIAGDADRAGVKARKRRYRKRSHRPDGGASGRGIAERGWLGYDHTGGMNPSVERVTVTLPNVTWVRDIDRREKNRSKFVAEAVAGTGSVAAG